MQRNITTIDLTLAAAFFPILVEAASVKQTISYRALVDDGAIVLRRVIEWPDKVSEAIKTDAFPLPTEGPYYYRAG